MATVIEAIETIVGLFQGSAIWLLIGAVVAYSVWADRRFDRRQQLGLCSRCGRGTGTITPSGTDLRMCTRCAAVTTRNHRLGFYVFLGMAVLGGLSVVIGTLSDISHGHALSWQYLLFFVGAVGPSIACGFVDTLDHHAQMKQPNSRLERPGTSARADVLASRAGRSAAIR